MSVSSNKFRRDVDGVLSTAALAALILVSSPKVARARQCSFAGGSVFGQTARLRGRYDKGS
jgi:hypothetical protein